MGEPEETAADEAFWRFSLAFYERPGVAEALITLQNRDGVDVNLVLFALWLGISGRGALDGALLAAAAEAGGALRSEIVEPLRQLRRKLRHHPDGEVQELREGVKALELAGEKLIQARLARLAGRDSPNTSPEARRAAADANFSRYLGPGGVRSKEAGIVKEALDGFAAIFNQSS
jgi:uncharacterized protein (TIGR02444 family)